MKVREARDRMNNLKELYDNAVKIQNCCLHNKEVQKAITELEEKSGINTTMRTFATCVASFVADERKRIENIINNADVKID